jgi:hypothetical protein
MMDGAERNAEYPAWSNTTRLLPVGWIKGTVCVRKSTALQDLRYKIEISSVFYSSSHHARSSHFVVRYYQQWIAAGGGHFECYELKVTNERTS